MYLYAYINSKLTTESVYNKSTADEFWFCSSNKFVFTIKMEMLIIKWCAQICVLHGSIFILLNVPRCIIYIIMV